MKKYMFLLALLADLSFASEGIQQLDLSQIGEGAKVTFQKDVLIPPGTDEVMILKTIPRDFDTLVVSCLVYLSESSAKLRMIRAGREFLVSESRDMSEYSYELTIGDEGIETIDCEMKRGKKNLGPLVTQGDYDNVELSDDNVALSVESFNGLMDQIMRIEVAPPVDLVSVAQSEESQEQVE